MNKRMRILTIILACCWGFGCSSLKHQRNLKSELIRTESIVIVEHAGFLNHWPRYRAVDTIAINRQESQPYIEAFEASLPPTDYPLIGNLAQLVCLDKRGRPIALADLILHDNNITFFPCKLNADGTYSTPRGRSAIEQRLVFRSAEMFALIISYMETNCPGKLAELRHMYEKDGHNFSKLISLNSRE